MYIVSTVTFNDIFKSSFTENIASFSILDTAIAMILAFCIGLFIFMVYKKTFNGVVYSTSFGVSLMAMTMITTFIILAVTSNVVLSLGMVGALSIVRFRTAVKESLDITYMFWAIASGIVLGAGMIPLAVIGTVLIGSLMLVFVNRKPGESPYIAVVRCADEAAERVCMEQMKQATGKQVVKSKTVSKDGIEITVEVRLKQMETEFVNRLTEIEGIQSAVLVSYNGDYAGN